VVYKEPKLAKVFLFISQKLYSTPNVCLVHYLLNIFQLCKFQHSKKLTRSKVPFSEAFGGELRELRPRKSLSKKRRIFAEKELKN